MGVECQSVIVVSQRETRGLPLIYFEGGYIYHLCYKFYKGTVSTPPKDFYHQFCTMPTVCIEMLQEFPYIPQNPWMGMV